MRKHLTSRLDICIAVLATAISAPLFAQSTFSGFLPGNLVLSRSVYSGDASTVTVGQKLPPNCPATATCTATAVNNGAYAQSYTPIPITGI